MSLIDNPLNGSTEIILENYFKEFLSTEDSNQINKMYLKISILSQVFLMEIAFDRVESGANIGLNKFVKYLQKNFFKDYCHDLPCCVQFHCLMKYVCVI